MKINPKERLSTPGDTNIEALLGQLQKRTETPTSIIAVGRASQMLETDEKQIHFGLNQDRIVFSRLSNRIIVTEDFDIIYDETSVPVIAQAMEGSYLANLCECYIHPLQTGLFLPLGWEKRTEVATLPTDFDGNLQIRRLSPLDYCLSKGAAGREKDWRFLAVFMAYRAITPEKVIQHWEEYGKNHPGAKFDATIEIGIRRCCNQITPELLKETRGKINEILINPYEKPQPPHLGPGN